MLKGASGRLSAGGANCGVTVSVDVAAKAIGDDPTAGAARVKVRRSGLDVVFVNRNVFGDCSVEAPLLGFPCGIDGVEAGDGAVRDDVLAAPSTSPFCGDAVGETVRVGAGSLTDGWPASVLAASSPSSVTVLVVVRAELASTDTCDSSSVLDPVELVCAPPVRCTMPVRGSGAVDESADDELSVSVDDVGADDELEEGLDGLSLSVDEEADELDGPEDEELDDELESDGSASATPGMVVTADPTPSATASAPTRPTYLT
jgi:hypothetical protein